MKLLLYCTKAKPYLLRIHKDQVDFMCNYKQWLIENQEPYKRCAFNGKIIGECDFEVEKIKYRYDTSAYKCNNTNDYYYTNTLNHIQLEDRSCLTNKDLINYLGHNDGYAIHIKNLTIYDTPKELSLCNFSIEKAPQNMCYATKRIIKTINVHYTYPNGKIAKPSVEINSFEKCVVISIRPEWLCKILNGEKTIEVRKKVLKEMM